MKLLFIAFLTISAYAQGAVLQNEIGDSYEVHTGPTGYSMKKSLPDAIDTKADIQLASALAQMEDILDRSLVGNAIINILESLRPIVIEGNDVVPPLDPLHIPVIGPFLYTTLGTRVTFVINNFNFEGLRWYIVDQVNVNTLRLSLECRVIVPWLTFTGSYDASAFIGFLSHRAGGNFRIFVNRLEVSVDTRLGASLIGGRLFLRELDINIAIHDVTIRIEGVVGSNTLNGLINAAVQSAAQNLLRDQLETVSRMLSEELFDVINEILSNFTLEDLLG